MKTIAIGEKKEIVLDLDGELRVKHWRKVLPFINNEALDDMGKAIEFVSALAVNPDEAREIAENLTMEEFGVLSQAIADLVAVEKKTEASSTTTQET